MASEAAELDGFLRRQLAVLEAQRPGAAARSLGSRGRWEGARAAFAAAVTPLTGLTEEYVGELLARRDAARTPVHPDCYTAVYEVADTAFVAAVMAAAALAGAAPGRGKART